MDVSLGMEDCKYLIMGETGRKVDKEAKETIEGPSNFSYLGGLPEATPEPTAAADPDDPGVESTDH